MWGPYCRRCAPLLLVLDQVLLQPGSARAGDEPTEMEPGLYWTTVPERFQFTAKPLHVKVHNRSVVEHIGEVRSKGQADSRQNHSLIYKLPGFLEPLVVQEIYEYCKMREEYDTVTDPVDRMPTFEFYPFSNGSWTDASMQSLLKRSVENRILPYIRERYDCKHCEVDSIAVRHYLLSAPTTMLQNMKT